MNRGWVIAGILVAAAAAAAISVRACAGTGAAEKWQLGVNYVQFPVPQPTRVAAGKVEVIEVFWYGCPHCFALEPSLDNWKQQKPPYVEFERVPVMWGPVHQQHARLYYTLLALGRSDLHGAVFNAIHRQGNPLYAQTDEEARAMQRAFLMDHGVSAKKFDEAYDSKEVADNLARAAQLTRAFSIGNVPTLVVNGKYSTSVGQAGDETQLFALVDDLAAGEQRR